jgi:protein involved in polysaccharide export with SLBB domain
LKITVLVMLIAVVAACGCGGPKPHPQLAPSAEPQVNLPERAPFRFGVGDKLDIKFLYNPTYNVFVIVRSDGMITLPYIGDIYVEGMTPGDLQKQIQTRFAEIVVSPDVAVIVAESASQQIFIFGEVRTAGAYDLRGPMTLLDAIASAGGVNNTGRKDSIILIRRAQDGNFVGTRVNLEDILDGHGSNVLLMPRDVIYVPATFIAKIDTFVEQFFTKITPTWYFFIAGHDTFYPGGNYILGP